MEKYLRVLVSNSIPAYFWLAVIYGVFVIVIKIMGGGEDVPPELEAATLGEQVEVALQWRLFPIPLLGGGFFHVTWMTVFVTLGFVSAWIEVLRALDLRARGQNDAWSLIVTLVAFLLFVGSPIFSTNAFLVVALVGFGDVLLDRKVGQAVARRDIGFDG